MNIHFARKLKDEFFGIIRGFLKTQYLIHKLKSVKLAKFCTPQYTPNL